ncbi:MAG TPA: hypothetical protein VFB32_04205 [Rudaea sp.]|nr:hypothetical protein [Rudaea sp.]
MKTFNAKSIGLALVVSLAVSSTAFAAGARGGAVGAPHSAPTMTTPTRVGAPTTARTTRQAHATGQPNQTCGSATAPNTPGNAAAAPGSAFNPDGKSGTVYAGQQPQNSKNPVSVSQYDVACSHQP